VPSQAVPSQAVPSQAGGARPAGSAGRAGGDRRAGGTPDPSGNAPGKAHAAGAEHASPAGKAHKSRRAASRAPGAAPRGGRWIALAAAASVLVIAVGVTLLLTSRSAGSDQGSAGGRVASGRLIRLVAVDHAAAAAPHSDAVVAFLDRYFSAINERDYLAYRRLFSPAVRGGLSDAVFGARYAGTRDSRVTLRKIRVLGPGAVEALITFTSHQKPGDSQTQSSCTIWRVSLALIARAHRYVIESPPTGSRGSFSNCG
jgi:hypothetical protein